MRSRDKAGMKASSFLKIGVNKFKDNVPLKNTYIYYIYNIIKRNTQGLVHLFYYLSRYCGYTITIETDSKKVRSRGKAGMKASSFLKIGVKEKPGKYVTQKYIHLLYI